jgi:predicted nucleic-acid-binding protein
METSDQEIYEAVMETIKARENIDINGGDDIKEGSHSHVDPRPTYHDVLKAQGGLEIRILDQYPVN